MLAQFPYEVEIYLPYVMTRVDEYEKAYKFLAIINIIGNYRLKFIASLAVQLSIAIARKVHQIPTVVYQKMVY